MPHTSAQDIPSTFYPFLLHAVPIITLPGRLAAFTFLDCLDSLISLLSPLSAGIKCIPLIHVLAASFSWLIEPSRSQNPYSCNVSKF